MPESEAPSTVIVEVNTGDTDVETPEPASEPAPVIVIAEPEPEPIPEYVPELDPMLEVKNRFEVLERRVDAHDQQLIEHSTAIEGRAEAGHSHSLPPVIEALQENLEQVESEEVAPQSQPWYKRKIFGK